MEDDATTVNARACTFSIFLDVFLFAPFPRDVEKKSRERARDGERRAAEVSLATTTRWKHNNGRKNWESSETTRRAA